MDEIVKIISALLPQGPMDAVAVGLIDFKKKFFDCREITYFDNALKVNEKTEIFFDIASLTKPLTNSLMFFLDEKKFSPSMNLCLNHRGNLPSWGLLAKENWREQILNYEIKEASTLYSDFSPLRVMLELQKLGVDQKKECQKIWDQETLFWKDLPTSARTLQNGFNNSEPNFRFVHDPKARVIDDFCTHAGLFSTVRGLCKTLLNFEEKTEFISKTKANLESHKHRFAHGWDRVENPDQTLAGKGCGSKTFGHLGFTGCSIWIDPDSRIGNVILSNTTKIHWYDKANLNDIRRAVGEIVWRIS